MKRILLLLWVLLLAQVPAPVVAAVDHDEHAGAAAASRDPRFEFLAGLAGTWVAEGGSEEMPAGARFEFRLTAGGTAIEEREMIGTPMEMVTLYHMDEGALVATHYCMLGNQPRMRAAEQIVEDTLRFSCSGKPGNAGSHDDAHIHGWSIRRAADGRLYYSAEMRKDGKTSETHEVVLTKSPETASR